MGTLRSEAVSAVWAQAFVFEGAWRWQGGVRPWSGPTQSATHSELAQSSRIAIPAASEAKLLKRAILFKHSAPLDLRKPLESKR